MGTEFCTQRSRRFEFIVQYNRRSAIGSVESGRKLHRSVSNAVRFHLKFSHFLSPFTDLMLTSAQNCPHHLALGLDELASVFLVRNRNSRTDAQHINKPFLIWLSDLISNYFENNFVIEELPGSNSSLPLEFMRTLNQPEDSDSEIPLIGINIAGCVLNPSAK